MTSHSPTRRSGGRRLRHFYVTTTQPERSPELFARIPTNATLGKARLEADAQAEHQARLASNGSQVAPPWQPSRHGANDA